MFSCFSLRLSNSRDHYAIRLTAGKYTKIRVCPSIKQDKPLSLRETGENQPVYDEFGSILLFVVLAVHRFDLQRQDLAMNTVDSFLFRYTREANTAKDFNELTEKENKLLGAWVRGLFEENEGIIDELMAASSPNDFHMLVATLLDQSMKACQAGFLAMSTLKDGLECKCRSVLYIFNWLSIGVPCPQHLRGATGKGLRA